MASDSNTSFYNQNNPTYTETNPSGPAATPISTVNTDAPSSFYKGTGTDTGVQTILSGVAAYDAVVHQFLVSLSDTGQFASAQPSFADISGMIDPSQIPPAALLSLGGVDATTPVAHAWVQYINTSGQQILSQPGFSDLSGDIAVDQMNSGTSASSTTFWRGDGTWDAVTFADLSGSATPAQLPVATHTTFGIVEAIEQVAHEWISYIDDTGVPHLAQPAFSDLSGTATPAQLPVATHTTFGVIESIQQVAHEWISYIDDTGVPHLTQPAFSDLSGSATAAQLPNVSSLNGSVASAQMPALTGDVTSTAGTTATTVGKLQGRSVSSTAPSTGQVLEWNGSSWAPATAASSTVLWNYLTKYTLSNDVTTPNTVLDIAEGQCADSTNSVYITLASAFTKSISSAWSAGSGNGGMGNGLTATANTWYHVHAIINGGAADVYFDTSVTAANAPSGTTAYRRLGSIFVGASVHITPFFQFGDEFRWVTGIESQSDAAIGTTPALYGVSVPLGVQVWVSALFGVSNSSAQVSMEAWSPSLGSTVGYQYVVVSTGTGVYGYSNWSVLTNTAQQIYASASSNSSTTQIFVFGWIDRRGRDN